MSAVDAASWILLAAGGFFCLAGGIGVLRMPDFYTRVHAASLSDSVGTGLVLLGLILQAGWSLAALKLAIVGVLVFFTSPVATHALARAAMGRGLEPWLGGGRPSKR